ncbi:MAG: threonylcarbamoyl-AMP synthase [Bradymonadaceae bacterium]|nr:threonylcarbamoyl-AMP synthase [Lujinxingiaceae bacterium]
MKIIKLEKGEDQPELYRELNKTLKQGGLVCVPCNGTYRILAALDDEEAVTRLWQSKRRVHNAPSLVFVDSKKTLYKVAAQVGEVAKILIDNFWPGPLTILFEANPELPAGVVKQIVKANGKIGVRIPDSEVTRRVVEEFKGALLASSANKGKKHGESSPAQIRKNFIGRIDIFVDAGDLVAGVTSTVVDIVDGKAVVTRPGAIEPELLALLHEV